MNAATPIDYAKYWDAFASERGLMPFIGEPNSSSRIFESKAEPNMLVRASFLRQEPRWSNEHATGKYSYEDTILRDELLNNLSAYGLDVVSFRSELIEWEGSQIDIVEVPRVTGVTIADALSHIDTNPAKLLIAHYDRLIGYFAELGPAGKPVLVDVAREGKQFMYGYVDGDKDAKLYLVDIDPVWTTYSRGADQDANRYHYTQLGYLKWEMEAVERSLPIKLEPLSRLEEML